MDYRGQDLDLRTSRWTASSTDPTGWREVPSSAAHVPTRPSGGSRSGPIWVDETLLTCANHAYDVALGYRSQEVRIEHLLLAMTRVEAAAAGLEAHGVRVASLRRDTAVSIAGEPPAAAGEPVLPRRSHEMEDVLRLAASRAAHQGRPAGIDDLFQVLCEVGGDLPGGDLTARYFPRPPRDYWTSAPRGQHIGAHLLEVSDAEGPLAVAPPQQQPVIDPAFVQTLFDRLADIERVFSERISAVEQALARQPLPVAMDVGPIESRLGAIESTLLSRPADGGVVAIDPALGDRLWAIEHALGTERTERNSAVTQLSDEISGVRSAVRLAAQNGEQGQQQLAEQVQQVVSELQLLAQQLRGAIEGSEGDAEGTTSAIGERLVSVEAALAAVDHKVAEAQAVYSSEMAEVHEALMKINANQHTLSGVIDNWRNNDSGEIHLINTRIGAVHEDGAKRLAAIEKLCADVDTLSQLVLEDRSQEKRGTFKRWLYGTEDWIRASWKRPRSRFAEPIELKPGRSGGFWPFSRRSSEG
jgi:hypothetical protein